MVLATRELMSALAKSKTKASWMVKYHKWGIEAGLLNTEFGWGSQGRFLVSERIPKERKAQGCIVIILGTMYKYKAFIGRLTRRWSCLRYRKPKKRFCQYFN